MILFQGRVRTLEGPDEVVKEALLVSAGRILFVGTAAECERAAGGSSAITERVSIPPGGVLMPAFHDSHVHAAAGGLQIIQCNLRGCLGLSAALETIRTYAASIARGGGSQVERSSEWVVGGGWQPSWFGATGPRAEMLEGVCETQPCYFRDVNGHEAWVNSLALQMCKIDATTADPPGGSIVRHPLTGAPTGHILGTACAMIVRGMPPLSTEARLQGLHAGINLAVQAGITSLHDALVTEDLFNMFLSAHERGEQAGVPVEVYMALQYRKVPIVVHMALQYRADRSLEANITRLEEQRAEARRRAPGRVLGETVKLFLDGVPDNRTACMLAPYAQGEATRGGEGGGCACGEQGGGPPDGEERGGAGWSGAGVYSEEALCEIVAALDARAFQDGAHTLPSEEEGGGEGEGVVERGGAGLLKRRHILAHLQFLAVEDLAALGASGAVMTMSPFWFQRAQCDLALNNVGEERGLRQYPCRSILSSGAMLAFGSDFPVSCMAPLPGLQVAVTRRGVKGMASRRDSERAGNGTEDHASQDIVVGGLGEGEEEAWNYDEAIPIWDAVRAYTNGSAVANFREHEVGELRPGCIADLISRRWGSFGNSNVVTLTCPQLAGWGVASRVGRRLGPPLSRPLRCAPGGNRGMPGARYLLCGRQGLASVLVLASDLFHYQFGRHVSTPARAASE
ncbi:amidohydrolase family-domain-containing protein, partial [Baffinella frigidus]